MKPFPRRSRPSTGLVALLGASFALSLSGALPGAVAAPQAPEEVAADPVVAPAPATATALERALLTVNPKRIRADLEFLASDEMRGRDTPSPEQRIAARYLRSRLVSAGVPPGAGEDYFYEYELGWRAIDPARSLVEVKSDRGDRTLTFGEGYFLLSTQRDLADLDLEGGVVWAGSLSGPELEAIAAEGKWLLCTDSGQPLGRRRLAARRAGARGLIDMPGPDYTGVPYAEKYRRSTEAALRGSLGPPRDADAGAEEERREVFSHLALTREAGLALLALSPACPETGADAWTPEPGTDLGVELVERRRAAGDAGAVTLENVCGFWPGSDPQLSKEVVIVSAHYDHVGVREDKVYNGADDNASGTCALLAVADALAARGPLQRSVLLMWVSGEEKGLLGSRAWVRAPQLPEGHRAVANVNIDMVGRNDPAQILMTPSKARAKEYGLLSRTIEELAPMEGFTDVGSADEYYERSDQAMFAQLGIPVVFLFTDVHEDYHQPTDDAERIDYDKVARVVRVVVRLLDRIQTGPLTPQ